MSLAVLLQAQLPQPSTQLQRKLLVLHKALVGVPTHLEVCPLLIDLLLHTINDLLDLLVLDMRLDQATGTNGFGISENSRRPSEDIKGRCDVLRRTRDEVVLGARVSTGDSLPGHGLIAGNLNAEWGALGHARLDGAIDFGHVCGVERDP